MAQFSPGQSGNARGRPKGSGGRRSKLRVLQKLLDELTPAAVKKIEELMFSAEKAETQFAAAKYLVGVSIDLHQAVVTDEIRLNGKETDIDGEDEEIDRTKTAAVLQLSLTK